MWRLFQRAKTVADIPGAIVRTAIWGALLGPFMALGVPWLVGHSLEFRGDHLGRWLAMSCTVGALFGASFYVTTGMPWVFLRGVVCRLPQSWCWMFSPAVCCVGGAGGAILSTASVEWLLGFKVIPDHWMARFIVIESAWTVVVGIFMHNYTRVQMEAEQRERKLAETAARAQANALQAQIAPHFFFNTLNSISALIPTDPHAAQIMIGRLAEIFRYTLSSGRVDLISLERELAFVREYLALEKIRYRERLHYELPQTPQFDVSLPVLTLQPLVENAIRHGIARRLAGGTVRLDVEQDTHVTHIRIWNQIEMSDGEPELSAAHIFRPYHALANTSERLQLAFGKEAEIRLERVEPDWVRTTLTVPLGERGEYARTGG